MRTIRLTRKQSGKLSDIISDLGLVSMASVVLPAALDKIDTIRVLLGLLIALTFWMVSLRLMR
ncbi:MAG: hypothetical protein H0W89_04510 [Candidatus Levybacteria bacterium]|nr:hypothetical protein [Candidatus Levybacteria bacterium]